MNKLMIGLAVGLGTFAIAKASKAFVAKKAAKAEADAKQRTKQRAKQRTKQRAKQRTKQRAKQRADAILRQKVKERYAEMDRGVKH